MADLTIVAAAVRAVEGDPAETTTMDAASGFTPTNGACVAVSGNDEVDACDAALSSGLSVPLGLVESFKTIRTTAGSSGYRVTVRKRGIMEGWTGLTAGDVIYNSLTAGALADADPTDGLMAIGTLLISGTAEKFKTTTTAEFIIDGVPHTKAAADNLVFSAADTINVGAATGTFWGAWLVQTNAAGTVTTKPAAGLDDQVYTTEALAVAALPAADADKAALGYITVNSDTDVDWVANTDDLTDASDCTTADFYDGVAGTKNGKAIGVALNATQIELAMPSL